MARAGDLEIDADYTLSGCSASANRKFVAQVEWAANIGAAPLGG